MVEHKSVKVWDIFVRVFHWSLVLAFTVAFVTHEDVGDVHIVAGYVVLALLVFRIVWGFIGSEHARFSDFIYSPAEVVGYLRGLLTGRARHYLGHNPAGGWMVLLLLIALSAVSYTGLMAYGVQGQGPLADATDIRLIATARAHEQEAHETNASEAEGEEGFWHEVHEFSSDITLALIFIHLLGVAVSSRLHRENLVKAMVTGRKEVDTTS